MVQLICGWSKINDKKIGILASNGVILVNQLKSYSIYSTCQQIKYSILFVQNTTGFMVGRDMSKME